MSAGTINWPPRPTSDNENLPKREIKTADEFLEKFNTAEQVKPEDNKSGLSIKSIAYDEEKGITIQWQSTSQTVMQNSALVVCRLYFIDPEDFANSAGMFTKIKEIPLTFNKGDEITMTTITVKPNRPSKFSVIYFKGITEKEAKDFYTAPLFFMAELGDKPKLLETSPRYAGHLFNPLFDKVNE